MRKLFIEEYRLDNKLYEYNFQSFIDSNNFKVHIINDNFQKVLINLDVCEVIDMFDQINKPIYCEFKKPIKINNIDAYFALKNFNTLEFNSATYNAIESINSGSYCTGYFLYKYEGNIYNASLRCLMSNLLDKSKEIKLTISKEYETKLVAMLKFLKESKEIMEKKEVTGYMIGHIFNINGKILFNYGFIEKEDIISSSIYKKEVLDNLITDGVIPKISTNISYELYLLIIKSALYINSGNPDLRHLNPLKITAKSNKGIKKQIRNSENKYDFEIVNVGFNYKKGILFKKAEADIEGFWRLQRFGPKLCDSKKVFIKDHKRIFKNVLGKEYIAPIRQVKINDIYFIRQSGSNFIKIGRAKNNKSRLNRYDTHNPIHLEVVKIIKADYTKEYELREYSERIGCSKITGKERTEWRKVPEGKFNEIKTLIINKMEEMQTIER